jgi:hypothetical protein
MFYNLCHLLHDQIYGDQEIKLKFYLIYLSIKISNIRLHNRHKLMETPITQAIYCGRLVAIMIF